MGWRLETLSSLRPFTALGAPVQGPGPGRPGRPHHGTLLPLHRVLSTRGHHRLGVTDMLPKFLTGVEQNKTEPRRPVGGRTPASWPPQDGDHLTALFCFGLCFYTVAFLCVCFDTVSF